MVWTMETVSSVTVTPLRTLSIFCLI